MQPLVDGIRSLTNFFLFPIRDRIRLSRQHYTEIPCKQITKISPQRFNRIKDLSKKYQIHFEENFILDNALQNYDYLDCLDQSQQHSKWTIKPKTRVIDAGSRTFYYAPALHSFFQPSYLKGVEIDAYRLYENFHTRYSYAQFFIQRLKNTEYEVNDFFKVEDSANVLTYFYPFVTKTELLRWGLPLKTFKPENYFIQANNLLTSKGIIFMVNCGEEEYQTASKLAQDHAFRRLGEFIHKNGILDRETPPFVSIWEKGS